MPMRSVTIIDKEDLKKKFDRKDDFVLIDVLDPPFYEKVHIVGAINIPLEEIGDRMKELDKNREVVTYCYNAECGASRTAARELAEHDFRKVNAYEGGIQEWAMAELPTEGKVKKEKLKALFT